tara:strand:+ start:3226 stop:4425 length:1200 start_codon:yes stop_codon:yes gene_type:complete
LFLKRASLLTAFFLVLFSFSNLKAQEQLSPTSSISLLTCGSGSDLYSIFGHTAIRVKDTAQNLDIVFNYGTFQFSDDFYVQFVMGKLNYTLSIESFEGFERGYKYENRWVVEQVLNLNEEERNDVYQFLRTNYLPENREYLYDFFYDNCSTRPRDVFETVLGDKLVYHFRDYKKDSTFHDMLDVYLVNMQWADCGMDLGLGKTADRVLSEREKMFLPDYVLRAYDEAEIKRSTGSVPLVSSKALIVEFIPIPQPFDFYQPMIVFWVLLLVYVLLAAIPFTRKVLVLLDILLYFLVGIAGCLILFLWFVTDHTTTQVNFDLLWALPVYLFTAFGLWKKKKPNWLRRFYLAAAIINVSLLLFWAFIPQNLNEVYIPVILILIWRNIVYSGLTRQSIKQLMA